MPPADVRSFVVEPCKTCKAAMGRAGCASGAAPGAVQRKSAVGACKVKVTLTTMLERPKPALRKPRLVNPWRT